MQHEYFAASNSAQGFVSYYPQIFSRADYLYIIKGGPGTGKSSLMKRIARCREACGDTVEYYYCSSDHTSLDGILIFGGDRVIGVIDGTPPHAKEPELPGVKDEIINLGEFWNRDLLLMQKNEIVSLSAKKSAAYRKAYDYLRCCGNLSATVESLIGSIADQKKLDAAVGRLCESLELDDGECHALPMCLEAVGMRGRATLDSFEKNAARLYKVGDLYGIGNLFLGKLSDKLMTKNITLRVSYDPISPQKINGLFINETRYAFVLTGNKDEECDTSREGKYVNPKRFVSADQLKGVRSEIRYAKRLFNDSLDGALHALGEARVYHFLLEDIYKKAMDFSALSAFTDKFCNELK